MDAAVGCSGSVGALGTLDNLGVPKIVGAWPCSLCSTVLSCISPCILLCYMQDYVACSL